MALNDRYFIGKTLSNIEFRKCFENWIFIQAILTDNLNQS